MAEAKRVPSMGKDDRNFRSHYYEKVGFRGVDNRKALELLWQEDPLNIEKFATLALKHSLPACDRLSVWKVILAVAPRYAKNKEKNWKWKVQPYEDNLRFMKSAGRIHESMPKATMQTILWLLCQGELKIDFKNQLSEFWPKNFSAISETMFKIYDDHDRANDVEVFYLSKGLVETLQKYPDEAITEAIQSFHSILSKHHSKLYTHMEHISLTEDIPLRKWFSRGFAGVLSSSAIEKLWDKVIGGSLKILVFAAVALIEASKIALHGCLTSQEAIRCLEATSEETDEAIAQNAIDMWMDDGCQTLAEKQSKSQQDNSKSPSNPDRFVKTDAQTTISTNIDLTTNVTPSFAMATVIKIGPLEELEQ